MAARLTFYERVADFSLAWCRNFNSPLQSWLYADKQRTKPGGLYHPENAPPPPVRVAVYTNVPVWLW
jgi:hypothetical protein